MHSALWANQRAGSGQGRRCGPPSQQKLKGGLDGLGRQLRAGSRWDYARISGGVVVVQEDHSRQSVVVLSVVSLSFLSRFYLEARKLYQRSWHAIRSWSGLGLGAVIKIGLRISFLGLLGTNYLNVLKYVP